MPQLHSADPLLILAMILLVGMTLAGLVQRIHLPGVTGQILAGVLLGSSGLALFEEDAIRGLQPLTHFALALIGVTVGAHLNLRRLRNAGKRLFLLLLAEATITPILVGLSLIWLLDAPGMLAALLATLAISTAPATIVAIVRETRSRGIFVKTLVAAVALNNMTCIVLFEVVRTTGHWMALPGEHFAPFLDDQIAGAVLEAGSSLILAVCVGTGMALLAHWLILRVRHPDRLATIWMITILLTFGVASYAGLSPLLACMSLGVIHTNLTPARDRLVDSVFSNFEPAIMCVFFTLAGLHLSFEHIGQVGLIAGVFFLVRIIGKLLSADLAMRLAGATERVRQSLGMALVPQAGVAIALVVLIQDDLVFEPIHSVFVTVVLTAVTLSEIVGPILTRFALLRAGEAGRDRPHLVDFLQEENIVTDLEAQTMEQAIEELTDLLINSHHLREEERDPLLQSALERERQVSTCLGGGLAVPHGELPEGSPMVGVMAISRPGLQFETPDGLPIHCLVLLATPRGERDRHLAVLAALARSIGTDSALQQQLYNAKSPAHVYEILHGEQGEDFNYFLGDPEEK